MPSPGTRRPNLARSELGMVVASGTDSRPFGAVVAMLYPAVLSNLAGGVAGAGARPPQNGRPRFIRALLYCQLLPKHTDREVPKRHASPARARGTLGPTATARLLAYRFPWAWLYRCDSSTSLALSDRRYHRPSFLLFCSVRDFDPPRCVAGSVIGRRWNSLQVSNGVE